MQPSYYVLLIALFLVLYSLYRNRQAAVAKKVMKKRTSEERKQMMELAKRFIGKDCLIYAFDGNHIREYPRDKKGKKKSVILD